MFGKNQWFELYCILLNACFDFMLMKKLVSKKSARDLADFLKDYELKGYMKLNFIISYNFHISIDFPN